MSKFAYMALVVGNVWGLSQVYGQTTLCFDYIPGEPGYEVSSNAENGVKTYTAAWSPKLNADTSEIKLGDPVLYDGNIEVRFSEDGSLIQLTQSDSPLEVSGQGIYQTNGERSQVNSEHVTLEEASFELYRRQTDRSFYQFASRSGHEVTVSHEDRCITYIIKINDAGSTCVGVYMYSFEGYQTICPLKN